MTAEAAVYRAVCWASLDVGGLQKRCLYLYTSTRAASASAGAGGISAARSTELFMPDIQCTSRLALLTRIA